MALSSEIDYGPLGEMMFELNNLRVLGQNIESIKNTVKSFIQEYSMKLLNDQTAIKKDLLFTSVENIVMTVLHDMIFFSITEQNHEEDASVFIKCCHLSALNVTPDQLGALEDYCIPLPATVVELASLDMHETPADKLKCLSTAFDLLMAELKGAIVDVIALSCDHKIPALNVSDITPILATILIHAKPMHLISNIYYIENFYWSQLTNTESECLLAFKSAIDKIKAVTSDTLQPKSALIYCGVDLEDVFKLARDAEEKFDRKGHRICTPRNPLERHIEHFTNMITACTLDS